LWDNSDNKVAIQADGSASFIYNCATYGNALWADLVQVTNTSFIQCTAPVIQQTVTPIKLTSFTGRLVTDNSVNLDWASAMEFNSYKYEVQRSADGRNFETVGTIDASGNSNTPVKYNFTDKVPLAGAYFYRLKQVDVDNFTEYSKVVYINSKKGAGIITRVFPNPFTSEIQLIGATSADMTPGNIKVFNITGQLVNFRIVGANAIAIDDSSPKGLYIIKVKEQQFKLLKQ